MSEHAQAHQPHGVGGSSHGSTKSYIVGFILSALLTVIPFWLVMTGSLPKGLTILIIAILAAVQVVVQLVYFLHMDRSSEQSWNVMTFVFTVLVLAIILIGSLWVMHNMNTNMMMDM